MPAGGVLADHLAATGHHKVIFVTPPANMVSPWTEQGVIIHTGQSLTAISDTGCKLACVYSSQPQDIACSSVLLVTERTRHSVLYDTLDAGDTGLQTLELIGDAAAPGLIADAVYAGHMAARNFEEEPKKVARKNFRREMVSLQ